MRRLLILLILTGCTPADTGNSSVADPSVDWRETTLPIVTDRDHYSYESGEWGDEILIRSTLTAPEAQPLYIVNCNGRFPTGLQKLGDGVWTDSWASVENQCLSSPITIGPGESHEYEIVIREGSGSLLGPRVSHPLPSPGTYRVVWHSVLTSYDPDRYPLGELLPLEQRVSAPIMIE